jgi:UDP-N-acetylmuramoyl-L-alanyl-D-glutamate--2,6-diaminopimelate ligase
VKSLKEILYKVSLLSTVGDMSIAVKQLHFDSRKVEEGDLFVAIKGTQVDGHDFIEKAIEKGAAVIVAETVPEKALDVVYVQVRDSAEALGIMAANFYDHPSRKLKLVGITGTNGKTTTVFLLCHLFRDLGYNTGLLSTVHNMIKERQIPASHTTADALQINRLLNDMVEEGCTHCFMEVSSHAISQKRVAGLEFDLGVFTNITHDHLDYHVTFDDYIAAKKRLFDTLPADATALINADDKRAKVMVQNTRAKQMFYSLKVPVDFKARILSNTPLGLELEIDGFKTWFKLTGDFNAYNILAAYAVAVILKEEREQALTLLSSAKAVPGRFERIEEGGDMLVIVDYAHTPDALQNVLKTIQSIRTRNEQVITVVGCGGNRDKAKRPKMADIACKLSDKVIFTSDNPRDESPEAIIDEMKAGVGAADFKKTLTIVDRREAIRTAVALADKHDIILVAGKGHEEYQEIKGVKHEFSDRKVLIETLAEISK